MSEKPAPRVTRDSEEFWAFAADGALMLRTCNACKALMYYPRVLCTRCMSTDLGWVRASGRGQVYAFTFVHRAPTEAFRADAPYPVAIVELEEGPRLMSNIIGCAPEDVRIGLPVDVTFEARGEGVAVPLFRPRSESPP